MDDILINAINQLDLERYTEAVMHRLNDVGLALNREKWIFVSEKLKFLRVNQELHSKNWSVVSTLITAQKQCLGKCRFNT
jgi:hypothetical protein